MAPLDSVLFPAAEGRIVDVIEDGTYTLLKVTYDGEVLESETKYGVEISYSYLYKTMDWDILFSNMGVGRGSIGIVPTYYAGNYVSSEYTILTAKSKEEALFYANILRTKEILGDILSSTTGLNRGRIKWNEMANIDVPCYNEEQHKMKDAVKSLEDLWTAFFHYSTGKNQQVKQLTKELGLDIEESRIRWLANKPPE